MRQTQTGEKSALSHIGSKYWWILEMDEEKWGASFT